MNELNMKLKVIEQVSRKRLKEKDRRFNLYRKFYSINDCSRR